MSTAVNAAVVVNLCAAVMWWWAARMRVEGFSVSGSVVLVGAALVGQTGGRPEMRRALVSTLGMVLATLTVLGGVAALWFGEEFSRLVEYWRYLLTLTDLERALDVEFFRRFTLRLIDSAWLVAGWLRYPAPLPWLQTMRGLTILAVVGYLIALSRPG
ncbi:MAG: hypothetical protein VYE68_02245, partial [Acidobacteriota bacterium]|nr:hypothetical protein [Acidobacteriota bacterium]